MTITITNQCKLIEKQIQYRLISAGRAGLVSIRYDKKFRLVRYINDGMLMAKWVVDKNGCWQCVWNHNARNGFSIPRGHGCLHQNEEACAVHYSQIPSKIKC